MSYSETVAKRFQERTKRRKVVAVTYIAVMEVYLAWRATIISPLSPGLSLVYFIAEFLGFVLGLVIIFCSWDYRHRVPPKAKAGLSVDIFVPTYQESLDIVRWTLIAAKEVSYPHRTILLDDGNRAAMRALAAELGVDYLARDQNTDAKAGNLNHGLAHSSADFVMVLDADHVVMPHALDAMLGFFNDPAIALVQTPQDFYNTDAFPYFNAHSGGLWHDQTFFYTIAQACRDAGNSSSCCGTGVVYRRSALEAIGGIPTDTVTEDMQTSLKLHKAGWETVYLNEPVAHGIAAADLKEYYKTRHRWAHGNLHALRVEKIFTCAGMDASQRMSYLTLGLIYLEGWQQLLLFTVPVISLVTGWAPFEITVFNVLAVLLFPILTTLLLQELGCGLNRIWVNEIFAVARFPLHMAAWLALFGRKKLRFRSSQKIMRGKVDWKLLTPQLTVLALSLAALGVGVVALAQDFRVGPLAAAFVNIASGDFAQVNWNMPMTEGYTLELVVVSGFWALFNATRIGVLIRKAVADQKRQAHDYLFSVNQPLELEAEHLPVSARAERISWSSVSGRVYGGIGLRTGQQLRGVLHAAAGAIPVEIRLRDTPDEEGRFTGDFVWSDPARRDQLIRSLLSSDWQRGLLHGQVYFTTPLEALGRLLRGRWPFAKARSGPTPVLIGPSNGEHGQFALLSGEPDDATLVAFQPLQPGAVLDVAMYGRAAIEPRRLHIDKLEPLASLGVQALDGAQARRYRARIFHDEAMKIPQPVVIAAE